MAGGESLWNALEARYGSDLHMLRLGEQPDVRVSQLLNTADFGIATSPYCLLAKSGTATAMLEHGLPVIVNREDGAPLDESAGEIDHRRVIRLDARFETRLLEVSRIAARPLRAAVASQFLSDLRAASVEQSAPGVLDVA
jgi:hypothetical protein